MPNSKSILKILFALGVWSFVVIGLFKIHSNNIVLEDYPQAPMSGRLLLQKDSKFNFEATSTTTDRILPLDVLIDSRQGKQFVSIYFSVEIKLQITTLKIAPYLKCYNCEPKQRILDTFFFSSLFASQVSMMSHWCVMLRIVYHHCRLHTGVNIRIFRRKKAQHVPNIRQYLN